MKGGSTKGINSYCMPYGCNGYMVGNELCARGWLVGGSQKGMYYNWGLFGGRQVFRDFLGV